MIPRECSEQSLRRCLKSRVTIQLTRRLSQSSSISLSLQSIQLQTSRKFRQSATFLPPRQITRELHQSNQAALQFYLSLLQLYILSKLRMVKIATITHQPTAAHQHTPNAQHPFSRAREFTRAHNATKLRKIFSKPLVAALQGHTDGISVLAKCPLALSRLLSGAHDGEIRLWDLAQRKTILSLYDHRDSVKGVSFSRDGTHLLSSSLDKSIQLYNFRSLLKQAQEQQEEHLSGDFRLSNQKNKPQAMTKYLSKHILGNVDHSLGAPEFATSGQVVQVWSYERSHPVYQLEWNIDSILKVKYNPSDYNLLAATCIDRSLILYDLRGETPVQKITLPNKAMALCFNPLEPMNLVVGNDDSNCYSFDLRRMEKARTIHKGHVGAVTDVDFASNGRQFLSGSFDRTIRIFAHDAPSSREVYHTKRMQIVSSVQFTMDSHYVLSGSEDMNVRLWRSVAWRAEGAQSSREERASLYRDKLIEKYGQSNKIRRIANHRHLPKYIVNANQRRQEQSASRLHKKLNKEANTGVIEQLPSLKRRLVENIEIQEDENPRRMTKKKQEEREEVREVEEQEEE